MKQLLLSLTVLFGLTAMQAQTLKSQLGLSLASIQSNAKNDTTMHLLGKPETSEDGKKFITYIVETDMYKPIPNQDISTGYIYYFKKGSDGKEICDYQQIVLPISKTNACVAFIKSKFVEIGDMQWRDYVTNEIWIVTVQKDFGLCKIDIQYAK